ncbi:hypothetical protein L2E82_50759 [Cichorium intybus]|nr:hypothetical protein L2E82_50759 [Cichorium intybus]
MCLQDGTTFDRPPGVRGPKQWRRLHESAYEKEVEDEVEVEVSAVGEISSDKPEEYWEPDMEMEYSRWPGTKIGGAGGDVYDKRNSVG